MASPADESELVDAALRDEIVMVGDLVVAAGECAGAMSQDRIDEVLGVQSAGGDVSAGDVTARHVASSI